MQSRSPIYRVGCPGVFGGIFRKFFTNPHPPSMLPLHRTEPGPDQAFRRDSRDIWERPVAHCQNSLTPVAAAQHSSMMMTVPIIIIEVVGGVDCEIERNGKRRTNRDGPGGHGGRIPRQTLCYFTNNDGSKHKQEREKNGILPTTILCTGDGGRWDQFSQSHQRDTSRG